MEKCFKRLTFDNIKLIFPLKQKAVYEMIQVCKNDKNVKKIIIFGSSVTGACNPWSDIDIYFELENPVNKLSFAKNNNQAWDRWSNFSVNDNLKNEILKTGVVVYDRNRSK